jgi:hypothetical protein
LHAQKKVTKKSAANSIEKFLGLTLRCELAFGKVLIREQIEVAISLIRGFPGRSIRRIWKSSFLYSTSGE